MDKESKVGDEKILRNVTRYGHGQTCVQSTLDWWATKKSAREISNHLNFRGRDTIATTQYLHQTEMRSTNELR